MNLSRKVVLAKDGLPEKRSLALVKGLGYNIQILPPRGASLHFLSPGKIGNRLRSDRFRIGTDVRNYRTVHIVHIFSDSSFPSWFKRAIVNIFNIKTTAIILTDNIIIRKIKILHTHN
jgi:hypothetical protein